MHRVSTTSRHCEERSNLYIGHSMEHNFLAVRSATNFLSLICIAKGLLRSSQ